MWSHTYYTSQFWKNCFRISYQIDMQPPSIPFPLHNMGFMCEDCTSQSANGINIHQVIVGGHDSSLNGVHVFTTSKKITKNCQEEMFYLCELGTTCIDCIATCTYPARNNTRWMGLQMPSFHGSLMEGS